MERLFLILFVTGCLALLYMDTHQEIEAYKCYHDDHLYQVARDFEYQRLLEHGVVLKKECRAEVMTKEDFYQIRKLLRHNSK